MKPPLRVNPHKEKARKAFLVRISTLNRWIVKALGGLDYLYEHFELDGRRSWIRQNEEGVFQMKYALARNKDTVGNLVQIELDPDQGKLRMTFFLHRSPTLRPVMEYRDLELSDLHRILVYHLHRYETSE